MSYLVWSNEPPKTETDWDQVRKKLHDDPRPGYVALQDFILEELGKYKIEYENGKIDTFLATSSDLQLLSGEAYTIGVYNRALKILVEEGKILRKEPRVRFDSVEYCLASMESELRKKIREENNEIAKDPGKRAIKILERHGLKPKIRQAWGTDGLFIPKDDIEKLLSLLSRI